MRHIPLEEWDERVAPRLSRVRQGAFWIKEEALEIAHAIKMIESVLPEWPLEAAHQLRGTARELRATADRIDESVEKMEAQQRKTAKVK